MGLWEVEFVVLSQSLGIYKLPDSLHCDLCIYVLGCSEILAPKSDCFTVRFLVEENASIYFVTQGEYFFVNIKMFRIGYA